MRYGERRELSTRVSYRKANDLELDSVTDPAPDSSTEYLVSGAIKSTEAVLGVSFTVTWMLPL